MLYTDKTKKKNETSVPPDCYCRSPRALMKLPDCKMTFGVLHSIHSSSHRIATLPRLKKVEGSTDLSQLVRLCVATRIFFECCCLLFKKQAPELRLHVRTRLLPLFFRHLTDPRMEFGHFRHFSIGRTALLITPPADAQIPSYVNTFALQLLLSAPILKTRFRRHSCLLVRCIAYILIKTIQFYSGC